MRVVDDTNTRHDFDFPWVILPELTRQSTSPGILLQGRFLASLTEENGQSILSGMRTIWVVSGIVLLAVLGPACSETDAYTGTFEADFFKERPWLNDVSSWWSKGCGRGEPTEARYMGDFGVGNGHVFALSGYACPLNTLHTMVGPDYQQESVFFRDTSVQAAIGSDPVKVRDGRMFRVRRTAILVSSERADDLHLYTITFAPRRADRDDPLNRAMIRIAVVENLASGPLTNVELLTEEGTVTREGRHRTLVALSPDAADPSVVSLGEFSRGEEKVAVFAYVTSIGGEGESETISALRATDVDALLEETRDRWLAAVGRAAKLESPDPRVDDLLEGMLVTILNQQTYLGGVSPMSRYTLMWIRDTAGAVRFFARMGLLEEARAMLDYYHLGAVMRGDIGNALDLDYDPDTPPPEPDWASMPPFSGRCEGETPSYLPLMAHWYTRASGDTSLMVSQTEFLKRALLAQNISADGLIPFSGDETYRGAMGIALGLAIEHDYVGCCKSANSSFLFTASARALAYELEALGNTDDPPVLREKADLVLQAADSHYWRADEMYAPFLDEADPTNLPIPFEDVSTKPLWTGCLSPDDPRAQTNLENVIAQKGTEDGFLQTPLHPDYDNYMELDIHEGVYTGMMPGYYLYNLALVDHPRAEGAFNGLQLAASPSGNFAEYQIYDDHSALQIIYEHGGTLGDLTARYRPWEGGISLDAMVFYLTGFEPDAPNGTVKLAPRLPNLWPEMNWTGLRVGDQRFDLLVEDKGGRRKITVTPASGSLTVNLEVPLPPANVKQVRVRGKSVSDYETWSPFGRTRVQMGEASAYTNDPLTVTVEYSLKDLP
jgi:hypothetical protein